MSSEIRLFDVDNAYQFTEILMFDTVAFLRIFENSEGIFDFRVTYLDAQMELEGVLGL